MVSHDRYLLDECVREIAELENGRVRIWPGNYSAYTVARELELERQQQQWVTQRKEIARLEEAIRRFRQWANLVPNERHIRQARVKQRQIDSMDKVDRPVFERRKMGLSLRSAARGGERVVALEGRLRVRRGSGAARRGPRDHARGARRRGRPQRGGQDGARARAGRRARAARGHALGRPEHRGRLPLPGGRRPAGRAERDRRPCGAAAR